jgi:hypothetical protein
MEGTETTTTEPREITLEDLAQRMDMFGEQMNWLCENLQSLFQFVNAMGANGGGIRGLMSAMKNAPELTETPNDANKVGI